jgi:hypothetical protein
MNPMSSAAEALLGTQPLLHYIFARHPQYSLGNDIFETIEIKPKAAL